MKEHIDAYMSVESSMIFSITIFLFYLVIMSSSLLMDRCLLSQNDYVIALRGASFSNGEEEYGEVIYGAESSFDRYAYMMSRLDRLSDLYVFFPVGKQSVNIAGQSITVKSLGEGLIGNNEFECECRMNNPVMRIRESRY